MPIRIDLLDQALAERSFADFVRQAWPVLEPKTPFLDNWHIDLLAEYLEAVVDGSIIRLIINLPPRSGKSLLATIFLACWVWQRNPAERFMFASYSSILSIKHSVDRRALLQSQWYQSRWSGVVKLADDANQKAEFGNTQRGHMIATSVGASATGRGGNFLVCDDLINPAQANSDVERGAALRWFDETFSTRLDNKKTGRQIIIEQRTNANDLTGHLLAENGWHHIALPAIAEHKTIIIFPRSHTQRVREEGDILWPAREGPAELEAAKVRLGVFGFAAQYQQTPTARGGNLIKLEWLSATYHALPARFDSLVLSLDTAYKTGASNDYSAAVVIGVLHRPRDGFPPGYYLLDAWRGKVEFGELKRKLVGLYQTWRPHTVLVEDAASGPSLIQELRAGTALPIKPIKPDRDKLARLTAVTPILEARRLLLSEAAWWREDFIAELTSFPAGAHDDWCDALSMALNYLRDGNKASQWITASKLRLASIWVGEGATVEEAAASADISTAELQDCLDRARNFFSENSRFGTPRAPSQLEPAMTEAEVDSLVREYMSGRPIACSGEEYERRIRPALQDYAAYCRGHGDKVRAEIVLKAVEDLDGRFNFAA